MAENDLGIKGYIKLSEVAAEDPSSPEESAHYETKERGEFIFTGWDNDNW